jgi:hypothetical protein
MFAPRRCRLVAKITTSFTFYLLSFSSLLINSNVSLCLLLTLVVAFSLVQGFAPHMKMSPFKITRKPISMAKEPVEAIEPDFITPNPGDKDYEAKMFDMNRRVRLGRSRDQDGKSNLWSIEPKMQVVEEEQETGGVQDHSKRSKYQEDHVEVNHLAQLEAKSKM